MDKKVGIVSCYFKHNYGSMLQAYATQKVLDNMEIPNETINIDENIDFANGKKKYYMSQITNIPFIKSKLGMVKLKFDKKINKNLGNNIQIRDNKYKEFEKNFKLTKPYKTYKELSEQCAKYSDVIVGSDQLWLPVNVVADYYTLNWVPDNVNKVSYATSFGVSTVPDKYKNDYKKFLNRINCLSTREEAGVKLVEQLSDNKATLVCDPTLLLNKEEWMDIQKEEPIIKEKYILCYFLGKNIEHRKFAERLKEKTGCKIVSLNHADEYVKYSDKFCDYAPYDIGPAEWINLIRNAEYVCTDSFHGTVFSLINNTKFFTFERYSNKNSKVSTNSRIYSLLGIVDLKERILSGTENVDDVIKMQINFDNVNEKLDKFRESSKRFLKNSIK
ncbi:polysaccharide pyruvyl transferase [Clostridium sp. CAG:492]|nr:polysaccharide pyruvyl transferase [Clostridium sp. CAG:492]